MRVDEDPRHYSHAEPSVTDEPAERADGTATDDTATDDEAALADVDGGEFPPDGHSTPAAPTDEVTAGEPVAAQHEEHEGSHDAVGVAAVPADQTASPADDVVVAGQVESTSAVYRDEAAADAARDDSDRDESDRDESDRDESDRVDGDRIESDRVEGDWHEGGRHESDRYDGDRADEADLMAAAATGPDHVAEAEDADSPPRYTDRDTEADEGIEADERIEAGAEPGGGAEELAPGEVPVATTIVLWEAEVVDGFRDRWQQIQLRFIDDPRHAAEQAQTLTSDVFEGLSQALDRHRGELDRWQSAQLDDTEELRVTVRRYRDLLDRLLGL